MKNLYIDPVTQDLAIAAFNLRMTTSQTEALAQKIEARLRTFMGEWFLDRDLGIPYFQTVFDKQTSIDQVNALFIAEIADTTGVKEVLQFESQYEALTRAYLLNFTVLADTGAAVNIEVRI